MSKVVLIDTSVWAEYWKAKDEILVIRVEELIFEGNIASCLPIKTEIASAQIKPKILKGILRALDHAIVADISYGDPATWRRAASLAQEAYAKRIPVCGLLDRFILLCAKEHGYELWTLDQKLANLASHIL